MERDIMGDTHLGPEQMWSEEEPPVHHFEYRSGLMELTSALNGILLDHSRNHPYNSLTSMIRFHKDYRSQSNLTLEEFYNSSDDIETMEDSLCCVGMALQLRRSILAHLGQQFPYLESHMYLVTAHRYTFSELPESFKQRPPINHGPNKDHVALVLKFTLSECVLKKGILILDFGYLISFPIVVMEDGLAPHTGLFEFRRRVRHRYHFEWYNDDYVRWEFQARDHEEESGAPLGDYVASYNWFYIRKPLANPRQIEKRSRLNPFNSYILASIDGLSCGIIDYLGSGKPISFCCVRSDDDYSVVTRCPTTFLEGVIDEEVEHALKCIAQRDANLSYEDLKALLLDWIKVTTDKEFVEELVVLNARCTDNTDNY